MKRPLVTLPLFLAACGGHGHSPEGHAGHHAGHRFDDPAQWARRFDDPTRDAWQKPDAVVAWLGLAPTAHVVSDGLHCFIQVKEVGASHERHVTGSGRQAAQRPEFRWVNTMLGNLKTSLAGTYHSFDHVKYGARYLAEFAYRFNRRFDLAAMVPRLLRAAVTTKPHPLTVLRLSEASN